MMGARTLLSLVKGWLQFITKWNFREYLIFSVTVCKHAKSNVPYQKKLIFGIYVTHDGYMIPIVFWERSRVNRDQTLENLDNMLIDILLNQVQTSCVYAVEIWGQLRSSTEHFANEGRTYLVRSTSYLLWQLIVKESLSLLAFWFDIGLFMLVNALSQLCPSPIKFIHVMLPMIIAYTYCFWERSPWIIWGLQIKNLNTL